MSPETSDTVNVFDRPPTLMVYVEIWRPMWLGNEPRVFWRELLPQTTPPQDGWVMNDRGERVPHLNAARVTFRRGEWRVLSSTFFDQVKELPNRYFTVDAEPGRTYCWRPLKDKHAGEADKAAVRALRLSA